MIVDFATVSDDGCKELRGGWIMLSLELALINRNSDKDVNGTSTDILTR